MKVELGWQAPKPKKVLIQNWGDGNCTFADGDFRKLEIHEYVNLKGQLVQHLLQLSGALTKEETDEIKMATGSAKRTYPIRTENLVLREFVITDVQGLVELGYTTKKA